MPIGKYRGQPIRTLPTPFIAWYLSQDALRKKYAATTTRVLAELRSRFEQPGRLEAELLPPDVSDLV